jgi:hypothetical protein
MSFMNLLNADIVAVEVKVTDTVSRVWVAILDGAFGSVGWDGLESLLGSVVADSYFC